jgi:hypothetical protein
LFAGTRTTTGELGVNAQVHHGDVLYILACIDRYTDRPPRLVEGKQRLHVGHALHVDAQAIAIRDDFRRAELLDRVGDAVADATLAGIEEHESFERGALGNGHI